MTSRRLFLAAIVVAAGVIAAVLALRGRDPKSTADASKAGDAGAQRDGSAARRNQPAVTRVIDEALVATSAPTLTTRGRHAWRLDALVGDAYWEPQKEVHVHTADGKDFVVRGSGREGDDVILVERDDGTRYVGWLVEGADRFGDALGDAERPAQRLENVVRITVEDQPRPPELPPARLEVVIDGVIDRTLAPADLPAIASAKIPTKDGGTDPALDLTRDLGASLELIAVTSEGVSAAASASVAGSTPVVYANRRGRFKLAWLDAAGAPVQGAKYREVSRVELRRR